jgi:hypothetical protein
MQYYFKRYRNGMHRIKQWLPLVLLPVFFYLLTEAALPDRFSVHQQVAVQKTSPIALSRTPVDCLPMAELLSRPAELFLDDFALMDMTKQIQKGAVPAANDASDLRDLKVLIEGSMMLKSNSNEIVQVGYYGSDVNQGRFFVNYYSQRLMSRSKEGVVRTIRNQNRALESGSTPQTQPQNAEGNKPATLVGELQIQEHRALWRSERIMPSGVILLVSLLIWCIAAGIAEWLDPSFSTERQVSRYLNIPVVGVVPNMGPLIHRLESKK